MWKLEIKLTPSGYKEFIVGEDGYIVLDTEYFSTEFVNNIIEKHNAEVTYAYQEGLFEGKEIVLRLQNKSL